MSPHSFDVKTTEQEGISRSVNKGRSLWCLAMSLITKTVLHARSQDNLKVLYSILESYLNEGYIALYLLFGDILNRHELRTKK